MNLIVCNKNAMNLDNMTQINICDEHDALSGTYKFTLQITFIGDDHSTRIPIRAAIQNDEEYRRIKLYAESEFFSDLRRSGLLDLDSKFNDIIQFAQPYHNTKL